GLVRRMVGYLLFAPWGPLLSKLSAREITFPSFTRRAAATMSSGRVWFSVPISSPGPHLPQFLYFSAASRRSWRVSLRAGMEIPFFNREEKTRAATLSQLESRRMGGDKMTESRRRKFMRRKLSVALAAWALAGACFAQDWPNKPVRVIVPFAPGGPVDIIARIVGAKLNETLGQQFVVENRAGAGGNIGAAAAAKSASDGYTVLMTSSAIAVNASLYPNPGYDAERDFIAVAIPASQPNMIFVNASVPARARSGSRRFPMSRLFPTQAFRAWRTTPGWACSSPRARPRRSCTS